MTTQRFGFEPHSRPVAQLAALVLALDELIAHGDGSEEHHESHRRGTMEPEFIRPRFNACDDVPLQPGGKQFGAFGHDAADFLPMHGLDALGLQLLASSASCSKFSHQLQAK